MRMSQAEDSELSEQKKEACDRKEQQRVPEMRNARRRLGGRSPFGVGEEEDLVFGAYGRAKDGYRNCGLFRCERPYGRGRVGYEIVHACSCVMRLQL